MNQLLVVASIFIVQVYLVHSRTTEEVLLDFDPIFEEIHSEIGSLQTISHGESKLLSQKYSHDISEGRRATDLNVQKGFEELEAYRKQILSDKGLTEDTAAIQHCILEEKNDTQYFIRESYAVTSVCAQLGKKIYLKTEDILHKFFDYQTKMHLTVEETKKKCSEGKTPLEVQSCLIQELYFVNKPKVKEMEKEMHDILKSNKELLETAIDNTKVCFSIVDEEIITKKEAIKKPFEYCVVKAVEAKP